MAKGDNFSSPKIPKSPKADSKCEIEDKRKEHPIVNVKGTTSPPRFTAEGEVLQLPAYPITWTAVAVCLETAGPALDLKRLIEEANQRSRPSMTFAIIDAQELVDEELADEGSPFRKALLEAEEGPQNEESNGSKDKGKDGNESAAKGKDKNKNRGKRKGKEKGQVQAGGWIQPKQLQELLAWRQIRERDFEHHAEAVRRAAEVDEAKCKSEESRKDVEATEVDLRAAKKALQEFEERDRKRIKEAWWAEKAAAAAVEATSKAVVNAPPGKKGGNKAPNPGKESKRVPPRRDSPSPAKGKEKGKDTKKPGPLLSSQEERLSCQEAVKHCTTAVEAAQAQVIDADKHVVDLEARINDPFVISKIYCCLGFGDTAASLGELAASQDNLFCAILNIAKKVLAPTTAPPTMPPQGRLLDSSEIGRSPPDPAATKSAINLGGRKNKVENSDEIGSQPSLPVERVTKLAKVRTEKIEERSGEQAVTPLVAAMRAASATSDIKSPLRKISVLDVLWEERRLEDVSPQVPDRQQKYSASGGKKEKDTSGHKAKEEKGSEKRARSPPALGPNKENGERKAEGLQYTDVAEALVAVCINLIQQVKWFRNMDADTSFVNVPDAIPPQEVKLDHYKHLLDEVAPELVSVPIILHCMMEQVAMTECEDIEALEAANQRKEAKVLLEQAFLNLGKRMELPYHSPHGNNFLPLEFQYDEMEVPLPCEPDCTCELHPFDFDGRPVPERKRSRYEERLHVVQEQSSVGLLKSIMTRKKKQPHKIKHEPQLSVIAPRMVDVLSVEKRMVRLLPTPGNGRRDFPTPPSYSLEKRGTCMTALRKFSKIFFPPAQRYRKLRHIADLLLNRKVETVPTNVTAVMEVGAAMSDPKLVISSISVAESTIKLAASKQGGLERNSFAADDTFSSKDEYSNKFHAATGSNPDDEKQAIGHTRPCRFTQTEPLKYLPEKLPPLELAFDQSKLRPHESILNCRYVDTFPNDTFAEAYSKARLALPFERMVYDKDEDLVISVLFAEEGEHRWTRHVPSLVPFGQFCSDPSASETRRADFAAFQTSFLPATTYGIEDCDGIISETRHFFVGTGESLVCNGLPLQKKPEFAVCHKPQATMYKDGATFLLRGDRTSPHEPVVEHTLTACMKDGLVMCFYIAKDGTVHLQVTHPTGKTFELTSNGVILIFPTDLKSKELAAKKDAEETEHKSLLKQEQAAQIAGAGQKKGGKNSKGGKAEGKDAEPSYVKNAAREEVEAEVKKKGDGKGKSKTKGKDKTEVEPARGEPHADMGPTDDHKHNIQSIPAILEKEGAEEEVWRCILPSGTVVRYRDDDELQLLFANGNTSESQLHAAAAPVPLDLLLNKEKPQMDRHKHDNDLKGAKKIAKHKTEKDVKEMEGLASTAEALTKRAEATECQWIVTNNKGYSVLQTPFQPPPPDPVAASAAPKQLQPDAKAKKNVKGKNKPKGGAEVQADNGAKSEARDIGKKSERDGSKGKGRQEKKGEGDSELVLGTAAVEEPARSTLDEPKPSLAELPKKKVVQVTDPDSEAFITVREDLVILMQPSNESYYFVQHADGTQILTEQKEVTLKREEEFMKPPQVFLPSQEHPIIFCRLHNPGSGPTLDEEQLHASRTAWNQQPQSPAVAEQPSCKAENMHSAATTCLDPHPAKAIGNVNPADRPYNSSRLVVASAIAHDPGPKDMKMFSFSKRKSSNKIIPELPLLEIDMDKGKTCPHCQPSWNEVHRPPPLILEPPPSTTVWHMRKDGLPNIQGKLGEGVAVQLQTSEGHYCAAWSQPTQRLSVLLPGGVLVYTKDKTVFVDTSRGVDQGTPDCLINKKNHELAINTNGLHAFDLEEGSLYHTDKEGNGYVTHKGSIVNLLVSGLPVPPSLPARPPYEPIKFLATEETSSIIEDSVSIVKDPQLAGPVVVGRKGPPAGSIPAAFEELPPVPIIAQGTPQAGKNLQPPSGVADCAGRGPGVVFTPKLHIPIPPVVSPKLPLERDSQWGIKRLPTPGTSSTALKPTDRQLGPAGLGSRAASISATAAGLLGDQPVGRLGRSDDEQKNGHHPDLEVVAASGFGLGLLAGGSQLEDDDAYHVPCKLASSSDLLEMSPPQEYSKLLSSELGPPARIFVAHDGGYGFEICGEREFAKYLQHKTTDPRCHIASEGFNGSEETTIYHTFVTVEDLHKEPHSPFAPKEENPLPIHVPLNPLKKPEPISVKTMAEAKLVALRTGTKCPWIDFNFEFPTLPKIIAPCKPPTLPCCKETLVSFRRICEYPQLTSDQLDKVERALGEYEKWRCEVLEKPLKEWVDPRAREEINLEREISECVRQSLAEQKTFEAQERGVVDSRYAAGLLRRMRNGEAWRLEQMLRQERALQTERKQTFCKYVEMKCHPTLCIHKPDLLQKCGPYQLVRSAILHYWKCEEGLKALLDTVGETVLLKEDEHEEDPDQITMEEMEILIEATKNEAMEIFEEMIRLMEEFQNMNVDAEEKVFEFKKPEEPPCCFIEWMILIEKHHKKNYPTAYEEEAAELERCKREAYLRMAQVECGRLLDDMISETETEYARLTAYRSPSFHSSEYLRDEFWDELMRLVADPPPLVPEVEHLSPESSVTEEDPRSLFRRKWDTAPWHLNAAYLSVEEAFMLFSYFNSVYLRREKHLPRDRPQQFHLMPGSMDFQKVKYKSTTLKVAYLLNFHDDMGRFKINKLDECLKVCYEHGPVAPGMLRKIRVFFKALRVGDYKDEVEIVTEFDVFKIPISAMVFACDHNVLDEFHSKNVSPPHKVGQQAMQPVVNEPYEPNGPPPTEHVPHPKDTCKVVHDLLSWLESDTMGDVLLKGQR